MSLFLECTLKRISIGKRRQWQNCVRGNRNLFIQMLVKQVTFERRHGTRTFYINKMKDRFIHLARLEAACDIIGFLSPITIWIITNSCTSLKVSELLQFFSIFQLVFESCICAKVVFHAAFKFGWRVYFALRRKMLKPPIARLPAA